MEAEERARVEALHEKMDAIIAHLGVDFEPAAPGEPSPAKARSSTPAKKPVAVAEQHDHFDEVNYINSPTSRLPAPPASPDEAPENGDRDAEKSFHERRSSRG